MEENKKETRTPFTKEVLNSLGDFEKDVLYIMGSSTEPEKTANIRAGLVRLKEDEESYTDAINNLVNQGLLKRAETKDGEEIVTPREDVQDYFGKLEEPEK